MKINKGAPSEHDLLDEVPRSEWPSLLRVRRSFVGIQVPHDCRKLIEYVADAERMWKPLGFESAEDLVRRGLEIDPELAAWAVNGLRALKPDEPIPLAAAVEAGKRTAETMAVAEATKAHGGKRTARARLSDNLAQKRGTDPEYLAGRIKAKAAKDPAAAEVVAKVERGEYTSMRAAARDAGILKPADPIKVAARAIAKVPLQRYAELVRQLDAKSLRMLITCARDAEGA